MNSTIYELDNESDFNFYEQDCQHLGDNDLFKYLNDLRFKENGLLNKLNQLNIKLNIQLNDYGTVNPKNDDSFTKSFHLININDNKNINKDKKNVLLIDNFNPILLSSSNYHQMGHEEDQLQLNQTNQYSSKLSQTMPVVIEEMKMIRKSKSISLSSIIQQDIPDTLQIDDTKRKLSIDSSSNSSSGNSSLLHSSPSTNTRKDSSIIIVSDDLASSATPQPPQPPISSTHTLETIKKANLLQINDEYKNILYVYPKLVKYDGQKVFTKARNILIRTEFYEMDHISTTGLYESQLNSPLNCIFNSINNPFCNNNNNKYDNQNLIKFHETSIVYHCKIPQFYDEIKILLPLDLNEKHHILFKFYHISCTNAKNEIEISKLNQSTTTTTEQETTANANQKMPISPINSQTKLNQVETFIGYSWLPIFKQGRLLDGEKMLPISQNIINNYLNEFNNIKWLEGGKPLFKVKIQSNSTIYTTDPHIAQFYLQCEKMLMIKNDELEKVKQSNDEIKEKNENEITIPSNINSLHKKMAPILPSTTTTTTKSNKNQISNEDKERVKQLKTIKQVTIISNDTTKEIIQNSIKALHATDLTSAIQYLPTLLNRILNCMLVHKSSSVGIHCARALLHFIHQAISAGKTDHLKAFIKYMFIIDYKQTIILDTQQQTTIHDEIIKNLIVLINQLTPAYQDVQQIFNLFKCCWFFMEITLKSLCIYTLQYKEIKKEQVTFSQQFYDSLLELCQLLIDLIIKYVTLTIGSSKNVATIQSSNVPSSNLNDKDILQCCQICNRTMAMFIKKCLNILNKKFLFCLINKYLEKFDTNEKQLLELKFDFIRIFCNHEHYIAFSLPIRKSISNINEFADIKYEFILSDQFRQLHYPVGILLSQLYISLNENKSIRKSAISIFRNILCKHSYDKRYNDNDKTKLARIASLYLPFINIIIDNLPRFSNSAQINTINDNLSFNDSTSTQIQRPMSTTTSAISVNSSKMSNNQKIIPSSSVSISNGSVLSSLNYSETFQNQNQNQTSSSVLGVIAGLNINNNKKSISIDDIDDNSSLLSVEYPSKLDNGQLLTSINPSLSLISETTTMKDEFAQKRSHCAMKKDKLETNEIKDLLICVIYILRNTSHDSLLGLWFNYDDNEFYDFLILLEICLKVFKYRGRECIQRLYGISNAQNIIKLSPNHQHQQKNQNNFYRNNKQSTIQSGSSSLSLDNNSKQAFAKFIKNEKTFSTQTDNLYPKQKPWLDRTSTYHSNNNNNNNSGSSSFRFSSFSNRPSLLIEDNNGNRSSSRLGPSVTFRHNDRNSKSPPPPPPSLNHQNDTILIESHLCEQVGIVILNILSLILIHQKERLLLSSDNNNNNNNLITKKLIDIYFYILESNQSEMIKIKVLESLRLLINKTPQLFLQGDSTLCFNLCTHLLQCFNTQFKQVGIDACVTLYLLLRNNYESKSNQMNSKTEQKSISRVHSQIIISISQLIGNMKLPNTNDNILECLTVINHLSHNDIQLRNCRFALDVKDLTDRIRTIFIATSKMGEYENDPEMLIDLQYSLAKSYANCLELRRTWLDSMATIHTKESLKQKNYSEAAQCYLHISAIIAENLKHQGMYTLGSQIFTNLTPNIKLEEDMNSLTNELTTSCQTATIDINNQIQYTQTMLLDYLCKTADMLKLGERYDSLQNIFKLIVAIYETNRDYDNLQQMHQNIQRTYSHMATRNDKGHEAQPIASYYRVSFFGKLFQDENNKVYIYKEPGNTKLFEICDRLRMIFSHRFGEDYADLIEILSDSRKPSELKLDTKNKNYIQVTFVQPFIEDEELLLNNEDRVHYESNHNLNKFYYETSYQLKETTPNCVELETTKSEHQQHSELLRLCKRKIILQSKFFLNLIFL
jgi:hypothetical protein